MSIRTGFTFEYLASMDAALFATYVAELTPEED